MLFQEARKQKQLTRFYLTSNSATGSEADRFSVCSAMQKAESLQAARLSRFAV